MKCQDGEDCGILKNTLYDEISQTISKITSKKILVQTMKS